MMNDESQNALAKLSAAAAMLVEAKSLDEIKQIRDIAAAAQTYAAAAKLGLEAQNNAAEIKLRAERKAGELLAQLERDAGGRPPKNSFLEKTVSEYRDVLDDTGTTYLEAHKWQSIAELPDESFEEFIAETKAERKELTTAGALRLFQEFRREEMRQGKADPSELPDNEYRVWYADPPWRYGDSGVLTENDNYGRAERHYPTMSIEELAAMGSAIQERCAESAVLFLWVTSPLLAECFAIIEAWGFTYKTSFVWDKVRHNFGHYNSVRHELLLVCTRGSCLPDAPTLFDSVQTIERTEHSVKPEEFRNIIDTLYPSGRRIELFARRDVEGWDTWGNEAT